MLNLTKNIPSSVICTVTTLGFEFCNLPRYIALFQKQKQMSEGELFVTIIKDIWETIPF